MTANELDIMVKAMTTRYHKVKTRTDLEDDIYYLKLGLLAIGRNELAEQLAKLYMEIDSIDTSELAKIGTFR